MDRRQLDYFMAICMMGNITKAADRLFMTRQALSNSMRKLESDVGAKLFERNSDGVQLTDAGLCFKEYVEQENLLWEIMKSRAHQARRKNAILFGTHMLHLSRQTLQHILQFQDICPSVRITFHNEEDHKVFWKMLKENNLDVVLTRKAPEDGGLCWIQTEDYVIHFLMSRENPLAQLDKVDFEKDLNGQTYLSVSKDTLEEMTPHIKRAGMVGEYVLPDQNLLQELILADKGIFALPEISIEGLINENMTSREIIGFPLDVGSYLVYQPDAPQTIMDFIDHIASMEN